MATLVLLGLILSYIIFAWMQKRTRFADLARSYLYLTPFVPLLSLINHNIDHDRYGPFVRLLPFYFMTVLLLVSLHMSRELGYRIRLTKELLFLGLYAMISLIGAFVADDQLWALVSWSFTVPGCILFLIAGNSTRLRDLANSRAWYYTVLGFLSINLALIAYGVLTGRTSNIFYTRNFGSCFASNSALIFLSLYSGFAWLQARSSFMQMFTFFGFSALTVTMSLSRTSVAVALIYASFLVTLNFRQVKRLMASLVVAAVGLVVVVSLFSHVSGLDISTQLVENWKNRLGVESLGATFEHAMSHRANIFDEEWQQVAQRNEFVGAGFGNFQSNSNGGFRDGHNLLLTEVYENGWLAAACLYAFLACGVTSAIGRVVRSSRQEWSMVFCLLVFLFVAHTTGAVLSTRGTDSYYTTVYGWSLCFLVGFMTRNQTQSMPQPIRRLSASRRPAKRVAQSI